MQKHYTVIVYQDNAFYRDQAGHDLIQLTIWLLRLLQELGAGCSGVITDPHGNVVHRSSHTKIAA